MDENRLNQTLSILIPAYNEEKTIGKILEKIVNVDIGNIAKEIIIVDDASTDSTATIVYNFIKQHPEIHIKYLKHDKNSGKGTATRTAIQSMTGDYVIVQDADLEYDPEDYNLLLPYLLSGEYKVIYGSRFLNKKNKHSYTSFYWGGRIVSICTNILFSQKLTDEPTCYKMFEASLLKSISLKCTGFEFCPEITAKVSRLGHHIKEVPIHYYPRSIEEGKKIKWYDGLEAIWTLLRYRFTSIRDFQNEKK